MLAFFFSILMIGVFARVAGVALRMSWGILKILSGLIFLPVVLIAMFAIGLTEIAFPVLAIVGLVSLIKGQRCIA